MLFLRLKISCFRAKDHLVFYGVYITKRSETHYEEIIIQILKCWVAQPNSIKTFNISKILVVFPQIRYIEVFDMTN